VILRASRNLDTLQTIVDRPFPSLQLQSSICSIREKQRVPREPLNSLRVELFGGCEIAVLESLVALLFESVGGGGGHGMVFALRVARVLARTRLPLQRMLGRTCWLWTWNVVLRFE
jgi:hypothetical protein